MAEVINIGKKSNNGLITSPKQLLEEALTEIDEFGSIDGCRKMLILTLDDNDKYLVGFRQAGMRMSECNNICDIAKALFKEEMGY